MNITTVKNSTTRARQEEALVAISMTNARVINTIASRRADALMGEDTDTAAALAGALEMTLDAAMTAAKQMKNANRNTSCWPRVTVTIGSDEKDEIRYEFEGWSSFNCDRSIFASIIARLKTVTGDFDNAWFVRSIS